MTEGVTLGISTYNKFKSAAVKADLVISRLFDLAEADGSELKFNSGNELRDLLKLAYPERYKNKVADLTPCETINLH